MNRQQIMRIVDKTPYGDCHILGTVTVPYDTLDDYVKKYPKDAELVVYCETDNSYLARQAALLLRALNYSNIFIYSDGMGYWHSLGFPTRGTCTCQKNNKQASKQEKINGVTELSAQELHAKMDILI